MEVVQRYDRSLRRILVVLLFVLANVLPVYSAQLASPSMIGHHWQQNVSASDKLITASDQNKNHVEVAAVSCGSEKKTDSHHPNGGDCCDSICCAAVLPTNSLFAFRQATYFVAPLTHSSLLSIFTFEDFRPPRA